MLLELLDFVLVAVCLVMIFAVGPRLAGILEVAASNDPAVTLPSEGPATNEKAVKDRTTL